MQNIIPQLIVKAKSKKIVFENLTTQEQQAVSNFAQQIQQMNKIEFLSEDIICCINKSKGCPNCCAELINEKIKTFKEHGSRAAWVLYKKLLNDEI